MALYVNGATNFQTVIANGSETNVVYANGVIVYSKAYITFDEQGGSAVSDRYVWYGRTYGQYAALPTPTRSGYNFGGWFTSTNGSGSQITNSTVKTSTGTTQTLYAYWIASVQQTAAPSISAGFYAFNIWEIYVTNNDGSTATIYAEENDSTPDINRGSVASGSSVLVNSTQPSFATFTMYATAQASGETLSTVTSRTIT